MNAQAAPACVIVNFWLPTRMFPERDCPDGLADTEYATVLPFTMATIHGTSGSAPIVHPAFTATVKLPFCAVAGTVAPADASAIVQPAPAWDTGKMAEPIAIEPLRVAVPGFAPTVNDTLPLPVAAVGCATAIHGSPAIAVQVHDVAILIVKAPPFTGTLWLGGVKTKLHAAASAPSACSRSSPRRD